MAFLAPLVGVAAGSAGATAAGLGVASLGIGIIGTAISVSSSLKQGRIAQREANFQADQDETGAAIAQANARDSFLQSEREADQLREIRIRTAASNQAETASSGLTISGSAVDVMRDNTIQIEKDIAMAKYRGQRDAYNYGTQAKSLLTQATYTRSAGASSRTSANWTAAAQGVSGLSRAGSGYFSQYSALHG